VSLKIALVAAEPSGDLLGASLLEVLNQVVPGCTFIGIGGPAMQAQGLESRYPMEKLSVMGLIEVLPHLRELLKMRKELTAWLIEEQPDVFIGIDAPDFNLGISKKLHAAGIKTIQFVAPTVWAWKQHRVKGLRENLDLVLSIYPFEEAFLQEHRVPATYVGHPLADQIPLEPDRQAARETLGIDADATVIAVLPGSRVAEIERLAEPFIRAVGKLAPTTEKLVLVAPMVNRRIRDCFAEKQQSLSGGLDWRLLDGQAGLAMEAADLVLTASGTATLQALLYKRPMVVGYRLNPVTYHLLTFFRRIKIPYVAMANLLADEMLAPEYIQEECTPENLALGMENLLTDPARSSGITRRYMEIHKQLQRDAAKRSAQAVLKLIAGQ
jgi:lipid-A-disaccharide synthase